MSRFFSVLFLALIIAACGQDSVQKKEANKEAQPTRTEPKQSQPDSLLPATADTVAGLPKTQPALAEELPAETRDFNTFFQGFRKTAAHKSMKLIAPFVNFPFDEDGGNWTKSEFIASFQLDKESYGAIARGTPKKFGPGEYRLFGETEGMIFKKNQNGHWKWFSIHYAH